MQRNTTDAMIRLTVWLLTVAITIVVGLLLVDEAHRNAVFWITISSIILSETLWAGYPTVRVLRPNLPLPLATTFVLAAYTALVSTLALVAYTTSISASVLAALHLVGILVVLVIPVGIVLRGGIFIAEVNERHDSSRVTHVQFRNRFRNFVAMLKREDCSDLTDARHLATNINASLAFTVTESMQSVESLNQKLNSLMDECESSLGECVKLTEPDPKAQRGLVAKTMLKKLQMIQETLAEREALNKQYKR